jgi:malate dehydrogenase
MVPVVSSATIKGRPARDVLSAARLEQCVGLAVDRGAAVVALRKTGSAFIAPAHAVVEVMEALRGATSEPLPVSAMLHGQYGIGGAFLGVRARLARNGVAEVVEDPLDESELRGLADAADSIRARLAG